MNVQREYEVVCRGCKEVRRVQGGALQACLMEAACPACGDERQQVLRSVAQPKRLAGMWRVVSEVLHVPHFGGHARA